MGLALAKFSLPLGLGFEMFIDDLGLRAFRGRKRRGIQGWIQERTRSRGLNSVGKHMSVPG